MRDRLNFLVKESIPFPGKRVMITDLVRQVSQDARSLGMQSDEREVLDILKEMHDKQWIFMFGSGFMEMTEYGKTCLQLKHI